MDSENRTPTMFPNRLPLTASPKLPFERSSFFALSTTRRSQTMAPRLARSVDHIENQASCFAERHGPLALSSCDAIIGSVKRAPSHEDCCQLLGVPHWHSPPLRQRRAATLHEWLPAGLGSRWILPSNGARQKSYGRIPLHLRQWCPDE
jgi:hypothetical protein